MEAQTHIVIVGATSALAVEMARIWVAQGGVRLTLLGRDAQRLERVANDVRVRGAVEVAVRVVDMHAPLAIAQAVDAAAQDGVDIALVAHGSMPEQADCQVNVGLCNETLQVNGVSPVLFAEAFAAHFEQAQRGTLAVIGSVAGVRGRKRNYVYGAAKGLVARYLEGLQHRFAGTGVRVVLLLPGPTDTPMTAQLKAAGAKLAPAAAVARACVRGIAAGRATVYAPAKWRLIMFIVRHMPRWLFHKLDL